MATATVSDRRQKTILAVFLLGSILYSVVFFSTGMNRGAALLVAFIPDQVILGWLGGQDAEVGILDRFFIAACSTALLSLAGLSGWLTLWSVGCDRWLSRLESVVISTVLGLGILSLLTFFIGTLGLVNMPWILRSLLALPAGAAVWNWRRRNLESEVGDNETEADCTSHLLWLGLPFVLLIVFGAMLPPWEFDVREYHLQVPKEWFQSGQIGFLPHNVYGNMPLGAETIVLSAMILFDGLADWWWCALIGKTVLACFAPLTAIGLYAAGKRFVSIRCGVAAALIYLSIPWVMHVSMTGLNEVVVGAYAFVALHVALIWRSQMDANGQASSSHMELLLLAGFLAGSAAACKYPALLFVVAPLAVWICFFTRKMRWKAATLFLAAAMCAVGPWYAKNAVLTGNPVYPLVFGGATRTPQRMEQWNRAHRVPVDERGRSYSMEQAADPIALIGWRSRWLSPLLLPLAAMAFASREHRRLSITLSFFLLYVVMVWWVATHRIDRFLVPILPWAAWLAGIGFVWSSERIWRLVATGILIVGLGFNLLYMISSGDYDSRLLVSLESLRTDVPREPEAPSRVSAVHRYLNENASEGDHVLLVGDAQPFDLGIPALYNTCFDECIFERLMAGRTTQQRIAALGAARIAYVYIDWSEIARYRSPGNYGFTDYVTPELVHDELVGQQQLLRRVPLEMDVRHGELFEVIIAEPEK